MRFTYFLKKKRFLIFIILVGILYFFSISYFDEAVLEYVKLQSEKKFEQMVNEALLANVLPAVEGNFVELEKKTDGSISYAYLNAYKTMKVRTLASKALTSIQNELTDEELTEMEIPFGYFFTKLSFLSDGLKLPVKLRVYQAHQVSIETSITAYGINSSLFEINLIMSLDTFIQIPFQHERIDLEAKTLISAEIINGEVPEFYGIS